MAPPPFFPAEAHKAIKSWTIVCRCGHHRNAHLQKVHQGGFTRRWLGCDVAECSCRKYEWGRVVSKDGITPPSERFMVGMGLVSRAPRLADGLHLTRRMNIAMRRIEGKKPPVAGAADGPAWTEAKCPSCLTMMAMPVMPGGPHRREHICFGCGEQVVLE